MKNSGYITPNQKEPAPKKSGAVNDGKLRAIAYSMDALIPGFYAWFCPLKIRIANYSSLPASL